MWINSKEDKIMRTQKTFKGLTGKELLTLKINDDFMAEINGAMVEIVPRTLPFSNQAEISSYEDATHVTVQTRFMDSSILVKI